MIKYSLQNECLENIEAFTDEQISREMAVIESVLEIYNKTIFMMELSNRDVDLPDCSMFMESTFFQESDGNEGDNAGKEKTSEGGVPTTAADQSKEGEPAQPAQSDTAGEAGQQSAQNNNQSDGKDKSDKTKKTMTEEERKAYNRENWYRQINKKGNVENIFISIIAFIPRFFIFLARCVKKLFSKTKDKSKDDAIKKADTSMQNMTPKQISNAVDNVKDQPEQPQPEQPEQPQSTPKEGADTSNIGEIDFNSRTWHWYNTDNVLTGIRECMKILTGMLNNIDSYMDKQTADIKAQIDNCQTIIKNTMSKDTVVKMSGADLVASKDAIKAELGKLGTLCENLANTFENRKNKIFERFKISNDKNAKINAVKQSCDALKAFSRVTSNSLDNIYKSYEEAVREANAINNAAGKNDQTNAQQTQQRQSVSTEGGENNGGQAQNNQSNTR